MYEYKFEKVALKTKQAHKIPQEDYHQIIEDYANHGWRLVQIFDPSTFSMGISSYFELIFERKID